MVSKKMTDNNSFGATHRRWSSFRTSRTEGMHLAAGVLIFFVVETLGFFQLGVAVLLSFLGIIILAFILHELAHKFTAQYYGLWSEFRLDPFGAVISILTALLPFKILAPGSVVISGYGATKESIGKIALSGSLSNIIQALAFIFLARFFSQFFALFLFAAVLNAYFSVFNLIPLSIMDGRKVFMWNKKAWAVAFAAALMLWIALTIYYVR